MNNSYSKDFNLRYIVKSITRRWYVVILMVILAIAFSYYRGYYNTITFYEIENNLIVGNPIGGKGTKFQISEVQVYEKFMQTYSSLASTSLIAEKTAKRLDNGIRSEVIKNSISAVPQANTQFIKIKLRWNNPEQAIEILNAFTEVFIEEANNIYPTCTIQIIERSKTPVSIVLSKKMYAVFASIAGITIAVLIILGMELLDNTITTEEDVKECLKSAPIGVIPKNKKESGEINLEYIRNLNPVTTEAFRSFRTNIEYISSVNNAKTIMVTSGNPGEGKTLTAAILAVMMAKSGKRTILIDCDFRKPTIHKIFDLEDQAGLSNYLAGRALLFGAIVKSDFENLLILTAGTVLSNPTELLSSENMKGLIKSLRYDYDYIIIDTPPVGIVTDAQVISQISDGTILVVSSGKSDKDETLKAKELIKNVGGHILGVCLNDVKDSKLYKNYSYYYELENRNIKTSSFKRSGSIQQRKVIV